MCTSEFYPTPGAVGFPTYRYMRGRNYVDDPDRRMRQALHEAGYRIDLLINCLRLRDPDRSTYHLGFSEQVATKHSLFTNHRRFLEQG